MELKTGEVINLEGGKTARIEKELGRGGQGIVYEVSVDGKKYALKWYTCKFKDNRFKDNLASNIKRGSPNENFLWPLYLTEEYKKSFGYVMGLRPKNYSTFAEFLNNKVNFVSTRGIVTAALHLVTAFRDLHTKGLSYQDLNDGNFFLDTKNGDVLICDNDNVSPHGSNPSNIRGKVGYMAPEIVRDDKMSPSTLTDCHSLAVILFMLFCCHDPLDGKILATKRWITNKETREIWGENPIFIFDPDDDSNRPDGYNNPTKLWPRLPKYIQDAFIESFCKGMKNPNARLTELQWKKLLIRYRDEILICPNCGEKFERHIMRVKDGDDVKFNCGHVFSYPRFLSTGKYRVPLFPSTVLYKCHTEKDSDDCAIQTGEVVMSKNNPSLWGIKNMSDVTWSFITKSGELKTVKKDSVVPIAIDLEINLGNGLKAKIEK